MYNNDFVTSIISTNVRNVLNDIRSDRAQNLFKKRTKRVVRNAQCRLPPMAQSRTEACMHIIKDAIKL